MCVTLLGTDRREQVQPWLAIRALDGLTYRELSQHVGVPANRLIRWARPLRRELTESTTPGRIFVDRVPASATSDAANPRVEIVLRGDRRVILDTSIDIALLTCVVPAVKRC